MGSKGEWPAHGHSLRLRFGSGQAAFLPFHWKRLCTAITKLYVPLPFSTSITQNMDIDEQQTTPPQQQRPYGETLTPLSPSAYLKDKMDSMIADAIKARCQIEEDIEKAKNHHEKRTLYETAMPCALAAFLKLGKIPKNDRKHVIDEVTFNTA